MALETGTYISDLVSTNPVSTDGLTQADDHLRLIKSTVKATFPNISGAVTATHTELNLLDGVTATTAELNYVDGVTSSIQTQLDTLSSGKQPLDAGLTAYAALATAANKGLYFTGSDTPATYDLSAFARTLLDDADATAARSTLLAAGTEVSNTFTANQIIEVTDNTNAALRVTQLGTGDALRIEDSTNPDSTPVVVDQSGNVGIGTASPAAPLNVVTSGILNGLFSSTSSNFNRIVVRNTSGATVDALMQADPTILCAVFGALTEHSISFQTLSGEKFRIAATTGTLTSQPTYDNTGTGSNVVVSSAGLIRRTSSSIKYKKDVEALDPALTDHAIANLRPIWYRTKNAEGDDKAEWSHIGLIAEEVDQVEKRLVRYRTVEVTTDENGNRVETPLATPEPEDVDYARLSVLLLDKVQRLEARIAQLEAR